MREVVIDKAKFQGVRSGFINCENCGGLICRTGTGIKSLKLVFVCRCDKMGKVELDSPKRIFKEGNTAILKGNRLICPVCGEMLASFMPDSYVNMAFRIRCGCGTLYDKYKDYSKINRRLREYR